MVTPAPATCWPVDTSRVPGFNALDADVQARAVALAGESMRMLTGYRMGGCAVLLRPVVLRGNGCLLQPVLDSGVWRNARLGSDNEIVLPGGSETVEVVTVDGDVLPPTVYRIDNAYLLVRTDGGAWPLRQDTRRPISEPGTCSVEYVPGPAVDGLGAHAAGLLAGEFAKAATGGKCALPPNATTVSRQGVSLDLSPGPGAFPGGRTGIREVDLYVQRWNPGGLTQPSAVWYPGQGTGRSPRPTRDNSSSQEAAVFGVGSYGGSIYLGGN